MNRNNYSARVAPNLHFLDGPSQLLVLLLEGRAGGFAIAQGAPLEGHGDVVNRLKINPPDSASRCILGLVTLFLKVAMTSDGRGFPWEGQSRSKIQTQ